MGLRHAIHMAIADSTPGPNGLDQRRVATLDLVDGTAFSVMLSPGCEQFVGRFVRLPELHTADYIVRFRDPETASDSAPR